MSLSDYSLVIKPLFEGIWAHCHIPSEFSKPRNTFMIYRVIYPKYGRSSLQAPPRSVSKMKGLVSLHVELQTELDIGTSRGPVDRGLRQGACWSVGERDSSVADTGYPAYRHSHR